MMDEVKTVVQFRVVQQPVHPIKICVVRHDEEDEAQKPVHPTVFRHLEIELAIAHFAKEKHPKSHATE